MKKNYFLQGLYILILCSFCLTGFCQINEDSVMVANSEKWSVKQNKGLFGLSKPEFGNFTTLDVVRINSPVIKKKTKDSSYFGLESTRSGFGIGQSKFLTIEKTKAYKLRLATDADTTEAIFSIASVSKEKRKTLLGRMLSRNDEGKDMTLSYDRDVPGIIKTGIDSTQWEFFIENFTSGSRATGGSYYAAVSISGAI